MKRTNWIIVVIVAALLTGIAVAYAATRTNDKKQSSTSTSSDTSMDNMDMNKPSTSTDNTSTTPEATSSVSIENYAFTPANITVKKGTKVTWTNKDSVQHDVMSDSGNELAGPLLAKGETYSHTFDTVGTFSYHCSPHPYMKGTVTVTE